MGRSRAARAERSASARTDRFADSAEGTIDDIAARLLPRFGDRLSPEAIEDAVRNVYDDLDTNARIRTFLPVLAERIATDRIAARLRADRGTTPRDSRDVAPSEDRAAPEDSCAATTIRGYVELSRAGALPAGDDFDDAMSRTEQEAMRMGSLVDGSTASP